MGNVFMTMSRHDLGRQAVVILEKMRTPDIKPEQMSFLNQQADRLVEAFKFKVRQATLTEREGA